MLKLNLGCSIRRMKGWTNVDIVGEPTPNATFVKADITKRMPFEDNSAFIIYAGHILEHLDPSKYGEFLDEWVRILTPGGYMVIEVPNGPFSMRFYLDALERRDCLWMLRGLLALYGRPDQGLYMRHAWAFSVEGLWSLLNDRGLIELRRVPEINPIKARLSTWANFAHPEPGKFDFSDRNISMVARKPYTKKQGEALPELYLDEIADAIAHSELAVLA